MAGIIEEKMADNNDKKMALWVDKTEGIIVFNMQKYHKKVHNKNAGDSCQKEVMYALKKKTKSKIVPVVLEKCILYKCTKWRNSGEEMLVETSKQTYLSQRMELLIK